MITGTLGANGWYMTNVTVNWTIVDPESVILETAGCDTRTLSADTSATTLACRAVSDGGETTVAKTFKVDKTGPRDDGNAIAGCRRERLVQPPARRRLRRQRRHLRARFVLAVADIRRPGQRRGDRERDVHRRRRQRGTCVAPTQVRRDGAGGSPSARAPDANGWHNHAVTVTFQGADGTSGVDELHQTTYSGP